MSPRGMKMAERTVNKERAESNDTSRRRSRSSSSRSTSSSGRGRSRGGTASSGKKK